VVDDSPPELAEAVCRLLEDRALASGLATAGRELAASYRWRRATAPAEALYREWLEAAGERRGRP
jgi:glycosyltransferase involved in cell wall biosynthesis